MPPHGNLGAIGGRTLLVLACAILGSAALMGLPAAQAQIEPKISVEADVTPHQGPLTPGDPYDLDIVVRVTCESPGITSLAEPIKIRFWLTSVNRSINFQLASPDTLSLTVNPADCLMDPELEEHRIDGSFRFHRNIPAFEQTTIKLFTEYQQEVHELANWTETPGIRVSWTTSSQGFRQVVEGETISGSGTIIFDGNNAMELSIRTEHGPYLGALAHPPTLEIPANRYDPTLHKTETYHNFPLDYTALQPGLEDIVLSIQGTSTTDPSYEQTGKPLELRFRIMDNHVGGMETGTPGGPHLQTIGWLLLGLILWTAWRKHQKTHPDGRARSEPPPTGNHSRTTAPPSPPVHRPEPPPPPGPFSIKNTRMHRDR